MLTSFELEFADAAGWLMENGICKDESGCEVWLEHATEDTLNMLASKLNENRFAAHGGKDTDAGAKYAKPSKGSGNNKTYTMKGKDGKPLFSEGSCGGYQKGGVVKAKPAKKIMKEDVIAHLIENNYVNNEVSAEAMFNHISDEFLERIEDDIMEGFKPFPKEKVDRQIGKKHDQEQAAAKAGDSAKTNKLMQQRLALNSPASRKTMLANKNAK